MAGGQNVSVIERLLIVALLLITGFVGLRIAIQHFSDNRANIGLSNGALRDCPDLPNCVASVATRAAQQIDGFKLNTANSDPFQAIASLLDSMPDAVVVTRNENYIHATFKTKLLKFIDDVEFHYPADATSIQIKSASRLGKSDLGANRKRIEKLRDLLEDKL